MSWEKIRIGDVCEITSSKRIFYSDYMDKGVPFYRSKEIIEKSKGEEINTELYISQEKYNLIKQRFGVPKIGDILLTAVGTIGIPYLVSDDKNFYFKDGNLIWLRDFSGKIEPLYLKYWLETYHAKQILNNVTIGSSQKALTIQALKRVEIIIPEKIVQKKIVDILSAYDDLIENNKKQIKLLEEAAQRLYKEWFVDLHFPGYENTKIIDGVPEGWSYCRFSDEIEIMSGGTPPKNNKNYFDGDIPFYTPKDYDGMFYAFQTEISLTEEGLSNCHSQLYPEGTIIITARGTVGKTVLLATPMAMNQSCYALKFKNLNAEKYLYFSLRNVMPALQRMANGGVFDTIVVNTFEMIDICIPDEQTLKNFEIMVTPIMDQIKIKMKNNFALKEARDRLLLKLINGELGV